MAINPLQNTLSEFQLEGWQLIKVREMHPSCTPQTGGAEGAAAKNILRREAPPDFLIYRHYWKSAGAKITLKSELSELHIFCRDRQLLTTRGQLSELQQNPGWQLIN